MPGELPPAGATWAERRRRALGTQAPVERQGDPHIRRECGERGFRLLGSRLRGRLVVDRHRSGRVLAALAEPAAHRVRL